jgi:5-methylcytosine-specific restriction endonuclease McrA
MTCDTKTAVVAGKSCHLSHATCHFYMTEILNKTIVLVLNRNWQAINIRTPQEAFCQMATNVATALEIELGDGGHAQALRPVTWDEWITLPIRDGDHAVRTVRGAIRVPTVIVAVHFARVPKKRPKLCARTIRERDDNRCQYTGALLRPDEGSLDHVVPRSRGGPDTWENPAPICEEKVPAIVPAPTLLSGYKPAKKRCPEIRRERFGFTLQRGHGDTVGRERRGGPDQSGDAAGLSQEVTASWSQNFDVRRHMLKV